MSDFLRQFIEEQLRTEPEPATAPAPIRQIVWTERAPAFAREEQPTLNDARETLQTRLTDYEAQPFPTAMLLVKALPGIGKTTIAVAEAERLAADGQRAMYCGPRHDFFADLLGVAAHPTWWYEWLPRQTGEQETCPYAAEVNEWTTRGWEAMDFCARVCGWSWINEVCVYHAQKRRTEPLIFCQHQHAVFGHPLQFSRAFGDESPIQAFQHVWHIPVEYVLPRGMDPREPAAELMHALLGLAPGEHVHGPELLERLGGAESVSAAVGDTTIPADLLEPEIHDAWDAHQVPYTHLFTTLALLNRESAAALRGENYVHRVIVGKGALTLLLRHAVNDHLPAHLVWLDATANERLYRACFGRPVEVVDAQPATSGRIYQLYERANTKTSLILRDKPTGGKAWESGKVSPSAKTAQSVQLVRRIVGRGYRSPVVISFQGVLEQSELGELRHVHFYAARGTNAFEDCDATIIVGTPQPSLYDLERMAAMIFFERDRAFASEWTVVDRPYRFVSPTGQGASYPTSGFWGDPDLQAVLWSVREAEIIQAAHRGRPVNHATDIWLLTNVPIDELPPDELLSMREVMGAPAGVSPWEWGRIVEAAERIAATRGVVTIAAMMADLGLTSRKTASKYLNLILQTQTGWTVGSIRGPWAGPPRRGLRRE